MQTDLAKNIKRLRKEKNLTQEQLAKEMNVTPGAVYKWEQDLSSPDITTIIELARFFSLSVDALIGYDAIDQGLDTNLDLLKKYANDNQYDEAIAIAKKLEILYPNNFDALYDCAVLYEHYVFEKLSDENEKNIYIDKALKLLYKARSLINFSNDSNLKLYSIDSYIAELYAEKKEYDKAIEILKNINYEGINNSRIAELVIKQDDKNDDSIRKYLSDSLLCSSSSLINSLLLIIYFCDKKKNKQHLNEALDFTIDYITLMKPKNKCGYMNKSLGYLYFRKALLLKESNKEYCDLLKKAYVSILEYDSENYYTNNDMALNFFNVETKRMMDDGGLSSKSLIDDYINKNKIDEDFLKSWKKVIENISDYLKQ